MNALSYANEIIERKRLFFVEMAVVVASAGTDDASPSIISNKLISPIQLHSQEPSHCCSDIVQGIGNTVFSHLATLVHSKLARESFIPSVRTPGLTELLCCVLPERFPGFEG